MFAHIGLRATLFAVLLALLLPVTAARAELDTSILNNLDYDKLNWVQDETDPGSWYVILSGDPAGNGPYVILNKVLQGNFNRPHFHANTRDIYVVDGTWLVGDGTTVNPNDADAKAEGTHVTHSANVIHWDGAKDGDVLLLIGGTGPATTEFVR